MERVHIPFGTDEFNLLIEDLGLVPCSLITPTLQETIIREFQLREFDLPDYEKMAVQDYFNRLNAHREKQRKHKSSFKEKTLKFNF